MFQICCPPFRKTILNLGFINIDLYFYKLHIFVGSLSSSIFLEMIIALILTTTEDLKLFFNTGPVKR